MKVYKFEWECRTALSPAEAGLLVQDLSKFTAEVMLANDDNTVQVDAKSILGLLSLAIYEGDTYTVWVNAKEDTFPKIKDRFESVGETFNLEEVN